MASRATDTMALKGTAGWGHTKTNRNQIWIRHETTVAVSQPAAFAKFPPLLLGVDNEMFSNIKRISVTSLTSLTKTATLPTTQMVKEEDTTIGQGRRARSERYKVRGSRV